MGIGIIDADLIGRKKHRFPNLACMKISGYYKCKGYQVDLLLDYDHISEYDEVFISKVFTDTPFPLDINNLPDNVSIGGTGFYFDKAPNLPDEIEHHMPDYDLYDDWIEQQIKNGCKKSEFKEYTEYSHGFTTRGCFRKCPFCVNQKYSHVFVHSPLAEFYDPNKKKICLNDDNFLGSPHWKEILLELQATGKPFKFKQGLDERILTDEKCELLFKSKYDGDYTFAFDNIEDYDLIHEKLEMIRRHTDKQMRFYVLCGFDKDEKYDDDFWIKDIIGVFKRIELLGRYKALPYIMRFNKYEESPYRGIYITLARWCNQPSYFKKETLYEYITITDYNSGGRASTKYMNELNEKHPEIVKEWFYKKFWHTL